MEMEKGRGALKFFLILFILIAVGLACYIVYDKDMFNVREKLGLKVEKKTTTTNCKETECTTDYYIKKAIDNKDFVLYAMGEQYMVYSIGENVYVANVKGYFDDEEVAADSSNTLYSKKYDIKASDISKVKIFNDFSTTVSDEIYFILNDGSVVLGGNDEEKIGTNAFSSYKVKDILTSPLDDESCSTENITENDNCYFTILTTSNKKVKVLAKNYTSTD